jgi:hypothetical protein
MKYQIKFKKTKMWAKQFWKIIECEGASRNKFQNSTKTVRIVIGKYYKKPEERQMLTRTGKQEQGILVN